MKIVVASDFSKSILPDAKWTTKKWRTRDGQTDVYYTVVEDAALEGFVEDKRYDWMVDGNPAQAFFAPEVLKGWHSEPRGVGELNRRPIHIIYSQRRELTIHEKLAALGAPDSVIPAQVRRPVDRQSDGVKRACALESEEITRKYMQDRQARIAARGKEDQEACAAAIKALREIYQSYGLPFSPPRLPL